MFKLQHSSPAATPVLYRRPVLEALEERAAPALTMGMTTPIVVGPVMAIAHPIGSGISQIHGVTNSVTHLVTANTAVHPTAVSHEVLSAALRAL
jgi:hypothetical protein